MKKLRDYLPLYIGCKVMLWHDAKVLKPELRELVARETTHVDEISLDTAIFAKAKPVLYSSILASELLVQQITSLINENTETLESFLMGFREALSISQAAIVINELRRHGYDCDELIEEKLAIDGSLLKEVTI